MAMRNESKGIDSLINTNSIANNPDVINRARKSWLKMPGANNRKHQKQRE